MHVKIKIIILTTFKLSLFIITCPCLSWHKRIILNPLVKAHLLSFLLSFPFSSLDEWWIILIKHSTYDTKKVACAWDFRFTFVILCSIFLSLHQFHIVLVSELNLTSDTLSLLLFLAGVFTVLDPFLLYTHF